MSSEPQEVVEQAPETTPKQQEAASFKKDASPKVYISEDELKALEKKVLGAKQPDEKALYEKAVAEVRSELEKVVVEHAKADAERKRDETLQQLQAELLELKNRPVPSSRKGLATTVTSQADSLFKKMPDGKFGIPLAAMEAATREAFFKEHLQAIRKG